VGVLKHIIALAKPRLGLSSGPLLRSSASALQNFSRPQNFRFTHNHTDKKCLAILRAVVSKELVASDLTAGTFVGAKISIPSITTPQIFLLT